MKMKVINHKTDLRAEESINVSIVSINYNQLSIELHHTEGGTKKVKDTVGLEIVPINYFFTVKNNKNFKM